MGCCSHRRPDLPGSSMAPTDIQALRQPCSNSTISHHSAHLDALLAFPFPPPDKLLDNGTEELQYAHFRKSMRPISRIDTLEASIALPKMTCSKCGHRATGYCVQCRLKRYCRTCFTEDHQSHSHHIFMEYAVRKDSDDLLI